MLYRVEVVKNGHILCYIIWCFVLLDFVVFLAVVVSPYLQCFGNVCWRWQRHKIIMSGLCEITQVLFYVIFILYGIFIPRSLANPM